jgi:4-aminobutyrate aminotransferase-like enzyme
MAFVPKSISKLYPKLVPVNGTGSWITHVNGSYFLDFTSGIGALSTGHSHPYVINKVKEQLDSYIHMQQQIFAPHIALNNLNKKMNKIVPRGLDSFFYVNSGSEATDNAIKIAKRYTGKPNIITLHRGFHGRTLGALSVSSSNTNIKQGLGGIIPGMYSCYDSTKESLNTLLTHHSPLKDTAAFIIEPVQGEGGIHSIDKEFFIHISNMCRHNNTLIIADEVQCGSGRTGTWWNIEQKGIIPDILTFGKGIASGFPLAGLVSKKTIMDSLGTGFLGGTYGSNALCCAAASATIDVIENEDLLNNTQNMGQLLYDSLIKFESIKEVRQYGLMIAIQFRPEINTRTILDELYKRNIIVLLCGNSNQYIRLLPPLNISKKEVLLFIDALRDIIH